MRAGTLSKWSEGRAGALDLPQTLKHGKPARAGAERERRFDSSEFGVSQAQGAGARVVGGALGGAADSATAHSANRLGSRFARRQEERNFE